MVPSDPKVKVFVPYPHPQLVPYKPDPVVRELPTAEAAKLVAEGKAQYLPRET